MFAKALRNVRRSVAIGVLAGSTLFQLGFGGCDGGLDLLGGGGGYYPDYGYSGWGYFPDYGLYDPTGDIQDVVAYRQQVMDNSMMAWGQYMTGDYYGSDTDDPTTPTYWASGPEWP